MFVAGDPVDAGLAASLAHPGGNATGVSMLVAELVGKRLELLHELVPRMRRVALLRNPENPLDVSTLDKAQQAAREFNVRLVTLEAHSAKELDGLMHALKRDIADGMRVSGDSLFRTNQLKSARAADNVRLPAVFPFYLGSDNGSLMSYGPSVKEGTQRAAFFVDKILKGAKPSELPIEQMSQYELIINLRAARVMGIRIPDDPSL